MQISVSRQSNRLRQTNEIVWYPRFIADFYYVLVMKLAAQHYFFVIPNYAWRFEQFFGSSIYFLTFHSFFKSTFFHRSSEVPLLMPVVWHHFSPLLKLSSLKSRKMLLQCLLEVSDFTQFFFKVTFLSKTKFLLFFQEWEVWVAWEECPAWCKKAPQSLIPKRKGKKTFKWAFIQKRYVIAFFQHNI